MGDERKDIHNSDVPLVCRSCEARHNGVCGALTPEQLAQLARHTTRRAFAAGTELRREGDSVTHYSNVLSGVVKLSKLLEDGRQQIVGLQFAPDFVGRPFARNESLAAEAATEVSLCSFPKAALEQMLGESPQMEHRLHGQALDELDEARNWMLTLGRKTASERLASFFLLVALNIDPEHETADGPIAIELPLKRADIADYLGLTIETVSRRITDMRKNGLIEFDDPRRIVIPDIDALREAAGQ
ncbi:MAG: Crp/Fnr family transcriptional regulator [Flavobacteriaceae bacterium]